MEQRPTFAGETLEHLTRVARLPLSGERQAAAGGALGVVYGLIDLLDDLELGETPPATAFDPRWE